MSEHTKGPWRELVTRIDDARGYQICHIDSHGKSEAERDANRRLIAAAPELLSAAKRALNVLKALGHAPQPKDALGSLEAAIAKATS